MCECAVAVVHARLRESVTTVVTASTGVRAVVSPTLCWIVRLNRGTVAAAASVDYAGFAEPGGVVIMLRSFSW